MVVHRVLCDARTDVGAGAHRRCMTTSKESSALTPAPAGAEPCNDTALTGRLVHDPRERVLPSGDGLVTLRLSIPREPGSRPGTDWVDCALWTSRLRRAATRWRAGDWVTVTGGLRRRYLRTDGGGTSMLEVEVRTAKRVLRADQGQSGRVALD